MNRSTPGLLVHHQLPEFTQIHIYRVSDAIQPSHPLSCPSPPAPNPSQHQTLSLHKLRAYLCSNKTLFVKAGSQLRDIVYSLTPSIGGINWWKTDILKTLNLPIHEYDISLHLCRSLISPRNFLSFYAEVL